MAIFSRSRIQLQEDQTEKAILPEPANIKGHVCEMPKQAFRRRLALLLIFLPSLYVLTLAGPYFPRPVEPAPSSKTTPEFVVDGLQRCKMTATPRPDLTDFASSRKVNHRFEEGTKPVLLKNGTIWTGEDEGKEIVYGGSVFLDKGLIVKIGSHKDVVAHAEDFYGLTKGDYETIELGGKWVTPGLVSS